MRPCYLITFIKIDRLNNGFQLKFLEKEPFKSGKARVLQLLSWLMSLLQSSAGLLREARLRWGASWNFILDQQPSLELLRTLLHVHYCSTIMILYSPRSSLWPIQLVTAADSDCWMRQSRSSSLLEPPQKSFLPPSAAAIGPALIFPKICSNTTMPM